MDGIDSLKGMEVFLLLLLLLVGTYIVWNCDMSHSMRVLIIVLGILVYITAFPATEHLAVTVPSNFMGPSVAYGPSDARRHFPALFGVTDSGFQAMGSLRPSVFGCATQLGTPDTEQPVVEVGEY